MTKNIIKQNVLDIKTFREKSTMKSKVTSKYMMKFNTFD